MNYGYIRVSSEKQTVENQRYEITEYCKRKGLIIDKWIEESVSGARHPNVRKLGKILNTIDKGDTIYVTELSRLGRCAYMVIAIISHCLIAKANIVEIRDDKLIKDDSDSVQDTFLKVLFCLLYTSHPLFAWQRVTDFLTIDRGGSDNCDVESIPEQELCFA